MNKFMFLLITALCLLALACTDKDGARKALEQAGYKEIQILGYGAFSCSDDDTFATKFKAKGPTGVPVSGTVCSAWMKGKTIRLD